MSEKIPFDVAVKSGEWKELEIADGFIAIFQTVTFWPARSDAVNRKGSLSIRTTYDSPTPGGGPAAKVTESIPVCSVQLTEPPKTEQIYISSIAAPSSRRSTSKGRLE
jgi:hypothetical protein